ncbi:MAG: hypothetical protein IPP99_11110 [Chitinophagaceae bacterium]|nr:hypothetical protein [Chitinophagaceae bacterium]
MRKGLLLLMAFMSVLVYSCSRGGSPVDDGSGNPHVENPTDTTPPVITISTPTESQTYTSGSTIHMTGRISDDLGLYRGTIKLVNDANGLVLKEQAYEIHGLLAYNFSLSHTAVVSAAADYTVTVSFEDHGLNTVTRSVKVKVNP